MKNSVLLFLLIGGLLIQLSAFTQVKTALHSESGVSIFDGTNQFTLAYNAALPGDTIYLPGALFVAFPTIDKPLHIYGAGYHPDSTSATSKTILNGSLLIQQNADGLFIQGLEMTGNVSTSYNHQVDDLTISRCKFVNINIEGDLENPCTNLLVRECVIAGSVYLANASSSELSNNFVEGSVSNGQYNAISNNIFFYDHEYWSTISNLDNSSISNNVFFTPSGTIWPGGSEYSSFSNNVFTHEPNFLTNSSTDNYVDIDLSVFFVNQTGNVFDFEQDYHLIDPAAFIGLDGTEVGIFGGYVPFKEGTLPENPHVQFKTIDNQTNNDAELNIEIQVGAQNQ